MPDTDSTESQHEVIKDLKEVLIDLGVEVKTNDGWELATYKGAEEFIQWLRMTIRRKQSFTGFDKEEWR